MNQDEPSERQPHANDPFGLPEASDSVSNEMKSEGFDTEFDIELQAQLRDVSIPDDLKAQLQSIPLKADDEAQREVCPSSTSRSSGATGNVATTRSIARKQILTWMTVAAALILVVGWSMWALNFDKTPDVAQPDEPPAIESNLAGNTTQSTEANSIDEPTDSPEVWSQNLETSLAAIDSIEAKLEAQETIALERRLAELQSASRSQLTQTSQEDRLTSIMAMADQAVTSFGGSQQLARADMQKLVEQFPQSAGANLAEEFLSIQRP